MSTTYNTERRLFMFARHPAIICPGCGYSHILDGRWQFNGDFERPTFSPSLLVNSHMPGSRCHSFIRDGRIQFLNDCWHELAGKTVDLPRVSEDGDPL